jgi:hypothetical protein
MPLRFRTGCIHLLSADTLYHDYLDPVCILQDHTSHAPTQPRHRKTEKKNTYHISRVDPATPVSV